MPALLRFATLAISTEHQPRFLRLGGPIVNQIELPTPISPCLRIFIEVLLNEDNRDFGETTNLKTSAPTPEHHPETRYFGSPGMESLSPSTRMSMKTVPQITARSQY
jgi:hypothetical protein